MWGLRRGAFGGRESVEHGMAAFAGDGEAPRLPEAVGHFLGEPAGDFGKLGDFGCRERFIEAGGKEGGEVGGGFENVTAADGDEPAVGDGVVFAAVPAFAFRDARFFLLGQQDFQREPRMGKDIDEVHEVAEQIVNRFVPGTRAAAGERAVAAFQAEDRFHRREGFDDDDVVRLQERFGFFAEGGERGLLDFDERSLDDGVDAETTDGNFLSRIVAAVEFLQLAVERRFQAGLVLCHKGRGSYRQAGNVSMRVVTTNGERKN